jgi:tetratricopeptide (TPR) repeat protein
MQSKIYIYIALVFMLLNVTISNAQHKSIKYQLSSDRKRADRLFDDHAYSEAIHLYKIINRKDSSDTSVKLKLAESFRLLNNSIESEYWFSSVFNKETAIPSVYKLHYAEALLSNGKNNEAIKWFDQYSIENNQDALSTNKKKGIEAYHEFFQDSLAYTIREISINSDGEDFSPAYYQKGIIFLSSREDASIVKYTNGNDKSEFLNLYYAEFSGETEFINPVKFSDFDNSLHEGPVTFFDNNKKAIFSRSGQNAKKGKGTMLSLFYAEKADDEKWTIHPLPFNDPQYSLSHPCFDENTSTLYFSSDMPGGQGGSDIYKVSFLNGTWDKPVNMGTEINTYGNEMFPFVSGDSCLYFTSNGHAGMGGLDIFKTDLKNKSLIVENLGYPINSLRDDISLILNKKGTQGFFSSNRKKGNKNDDLYAVDFHSFRFEGLVVEKIKAIPQENVSVKIMEPKSGRPIKTVKTNSKGEFAFVGAPGRKYHIEVLKDSYAPKKLEVFSSNKEGKTINKTIVIEQSNKSFVSGKVLYDTSFLANCKVAIITFNADSVETIYSNENGQFVCEINTDTTNIFYIEKDTLKGVCKLEPIKRKRKASGISYIIIKLGEMVLQEVEIYYSNNSGESLPNETLYIKNELDKEEKTMVTDVDGKIKMDLWLYGKYTVSRKENNATIPLATFIPEKTPLLKVIK